MGLKEFLVEAKARLADLNSGVKKHVHIVIGNEACDLDSTVCATTYAYFLHQTKSSPGSHTLPVLCTRRSNFRIHLETVYFLGKHNIRADDLIFIDDLDLPALSGSEVITLEVTLVDHHVLSEAEECLRKFVVEALDHRPVDGEIPKSWHAEIEPVGSCSSIVARKMLDADPEDFSMDATVAELLLGAILTDTCNLSDKDKIATSADREMQVRLKSFLPHISATSIFEEIKQSKFDLSSLTILEMLNKDLKILKGTQITVAMSTVTMNLETILTSPEFCHDASEFCLSVPADVVIIMALVMGDAGISDRWIAVFSPNPVFRDQF
ncbi:exopolyphosphatase PRUNE1-like [Physella acuta]|uniref:exopolyphosphatase PRUNE1-like n=1 Tax=Physella acuta TaxID=109671 RepID=UPI0027DABDB3|nr:exopolyphosphatase PRUNE1-like [Physella acuta]